MADYQHRIGISAQQGTKLNNISGVSDNISQKLSDLGITHAGQLLGTAAVENVREHLAAFLGVTSDTLNRTISRVRNATPSSVASLYEGSAFSLPALGALAATAEITAKIAALPASAAVAAGSLPSFVNMAASFPPIRNQAFRGTCTAFAMTALHEYYQTITGDPQNLSEEFLFQIQKALDRVDPAPPNSPRDADTSQEGSWLISASEVLSRYGQCLESTYPYNPGSGPGTTLQFRSRPQSADTEAAKFKLATRMLNPNSFGDIKSALASGSPVPISIPVYNSWFQAPDTIRTGRITMPIDGEAQVGGHAVCLVGYQDDTTMPGGGYFILRNQWERVGLELGGVSTSVLWAQGSQYGTGYGTLPYDYMTKLGTEAYALVSVPGRLASNDPQDTGGILDIMSLPAQVVAKGGAGEPGPSPTAAPEKPGRVVIETKDGTRIIIS